MTGLIITMCLRRNRLEITVSDPIQLAPANGKAKELESLAAESMRGAVEAVFKQLMETVTKENPDIQATMKTDEPRA